MPPKKNAPKKLKEGNPENGGELTPEMQAKMFMLTCQSLQLQLAERSEEASRALAAKRELQRRVEQISKYIYKYGKYLWINIYYIFINTHI
jgi:hypothetical protein